MVTSVLTLKTAIRSDGYGRFIKDGTVVPNGIQFEHVEVKPMVDAYRRMTRELEFDVCEMSITTYLVAHSFNKAFTALPLFVGRDFHHRSMVYRPGIGISVPKDLEGRRVGVRAYTVTSGLWTRGVLSSEYGMDVNRVTWVTDDLEHVPEYVPPPNVVKAPEGRSLVDLIAAGEIDAAQSGNAGVGRTGAPSTWGAQPGRVDNTATPEGVELERMIPNARAAEIEWYKRTNIFPIHGTIVVKNSVLEAHPWVAEELFKMVKRAKELYLKDLNEHGPRVASDQKTLELQEMVGGDPMPLGVPSSRETLEALTDYTYEGHIVPRRYTPEEMFVPGTASFE